MFCSVCGQPLQPGNRTCTHCGAAVAAPPVPPMPMQTAFFPTRVHRNLQTLGVLWLVYAAWTVLGWLVALPFLAAMIGPGTGPWRLAPFAGHFHHHPALVAQFSWLLPFVSVVIGLRALLCVITGIGLMRRASWGRILAIVTAFLTLLKPITGTLLAIYTLWVLLPSPSAIEYDQISMPQTP